MRTTPRSAMLAALGGALVSLCLAAPQAAASSLDCSVVECAVVLPGAVRFAPVEGTPYAAGYDEAGAIVGWVARSTDVLDIKAYSGKPMVTLVGIDPRGVITGAHLLEHAEPILLVGIPEQALRDFIAFYPGKPATSRVVVGSRGGNDALRVDVISGATVTALAQNQTILRTARTLGVDVGVLDATDVRPGSFVVEDTPWSWARMEREGVFGRLSVLEAEMGLPEPEGLFVDLWFTIADAPQVGRALLGEELYRRLMRELEPGQNLFVILGNGSSSFKGSAFVRGGIFDRVRVRQGLRELVFRDTDYDNLPAVFAEGAPDFKEGAVFVTRGAQLDPGASFELVFLGSRYDRRNAYSREFHEVAREHRLPGSVYRTSGPIDEPMYVQAWRNRRVDLIVLGVYLAAVIAVFAARRWSTGRMARLQGLHIASMVFGFLVVGLYMQAQPSVTQILTLFDGVTGEWRWELFLSAPLIFVLWIFIVVVSLIWGRGVFCGWVCPYGAMTELVNKVAKRLRIPQYRPPRTGWHRAVRYLIFLGLVGIYLVQPVLAERLAEVEPFKTTFLVAPWTRHAGLILWWVVLLGAALFMFRPFCRYVCPLGAGLAIFGSVRRSGPYRRAFCSKCKICANGCEPEAIRPDGTIDPRECLSCMECEANFRDREVCPPLVGIDRLSRKVALEVRDRRRLEELAQEARRL